MFVHICYSSWLHTCTYLPCKIIYTCQFYENDTYSRAYSCRKWWCVSSSHTHFNASRLHVCAYICMHTHRKACLNICFHTYIRKRARVCTQMKSIRLSCTTSTHLWTIGTHGRNTGGNDNECLHRLCILLHHV